LLAMEAVSLSLPECATSIDSYLCFRELCGERLTSECYLVREHFNKEGIDKVRNPRRISETTLENILDQLLVDAGVRKREELKEGHLKSVCRKAVQRANGFRKYFDTSLVKSGVNTLYKELMMCHKIGLDNNYLRPTIEELLEGSEKAKGYLTAIDALTINEENRLKLENIRIKQRNDALERDKDEVILLRKELEPLLALKKSLSRTLETHCYIDANPNVIIISYIIIRLSIIIFINRRDFQMNYTKTDSYCAPSYFGLI